MPHSDSNVPQIVRVWADYYGIEPGDFDPSQVPSETFTIIADDVVVSSTPSSQHLILQAHINNIKNNGGAGKIILPPSSYDEPIWMGSHLDLDDLLYLEICGQGDPGLSGGWGTMIRQIVTAEDSERQVFNASDSSGNGTYFLHDFAILGGHQFYPFSDDNNSKFISIEGAERVICQRLGIYYCRHIPVNMAICGLVEITDCNIERNMAGVNVIDCYRRVIRNNRIKNVGDDAIAVFASTNVGNPYKEPTIIEGNMIEDGYGIKLMGISKAIIKGNFIERAKGYGIQITNGGISPLEGSSDTIDLIIDGNVITNVCQSSKWAAGASNCCIQINNDTDDFAPPITGAANPFINLPETVSPFSNNTTNPNAGAQRILITNNILAQTLPQVDNYSDWGYGLSYFQDGFVDKTNFHSGFHCQTNGVLLSTVVVDITIKDNIFERLINAVAFSGTFTYMGYCGIIGNKIRRTPTGGAITAAHDTTARHGKLDVRDNEFDLDPFFESTGRDYINGTTTTVTISGPTPTGAVITWTAHALPANTAVRFTTTGALPAGLTPSSTVGAKSYYVRRGSTLTTDTFTVSTYPNGPVVVSTDAGSGVHTGFSSVPDGTYSTSSSIPYVADITNWSVANFTGNRVRNVNNAVISDADTKTGLVEGNIFYMEPSSSATLASVSHADNKGVRVPFSAIASGQMVYENCDPLSATYGQVISQRAQTKFSNSIPTAGFYLMGEKVWNATYTAANQAIQVGTAPDTQTSQNVQYVLIGWERITTGSNHTLNTDWRELRVLTGN